MFKRAGKGAVIKQEEPEKPKKRIGIGKTLLVAILSFIAVIAILQVIGHNVKNTATNQGGKVSSGYCSSDPECSGFGSRNGCPALCGSDGLCHCCLSLRGETCISCSTGCGGDPNLYCLKGACTFKRGGQP